jgi:uncharacterized protein
MTTAANPRDMLTTAPGLRALEAVCVQEPAANIILDRAVAFDELVGSDLVVRERLPRLNEPWLRTALLAMGIPHHRRVATFLHSEANSGRVTDERAAVTSVILRGVAPRSALGTVPRPLLFTAEELEYIEQYPQYETPVDPVNLLQPVGRPLDYAGYLCAIVKLTRLCNLRCTYCHDWRAGRDSTMDFTTLVGAVQQILHARFGAIDFVWHGGEPLLLGPQRLLRFLALQEMFARPRQIIRNHAQSNGMVTNRRTLDLLRLFDIKVSVSIDGPPPVHDITRRSARNEATSADVLRGIKTLHEYGILSGLLVVVSPALLAMDVGSLWKFLDASPARSICFLPERPGFGESLSVSKDDFADFLIKMYRARQASGSIKKVRELDAIGQLLSNRQSGFCELAGNCVGHFVSVDPNGDISHCDKYAGDPNYVLGSLTSLPLMEILDGPRATAVRALANEQLESMRTCPYFDLCQGWCPHERHVDSSYQEQGCCGLGSLFREIQQSASHLTGPPLA